MWPRACCMRVCYAHVCIKTHPRNTRVDRLHQSMAIPIGVCVHVHVACFYANVCIIDTAVLPIYHIVLVKLFLIFQSFRNFHIVLLFSHLSINLSILFKVLFNKELLVHVFLGLIGGKIFKANCTFLL